MKKFLNELFFYFLNIAVDVPKGKGWQGALFLWPVFLAIIIIAYSVIKIVV